jgi:hypothetical protein
MAEDRQDIEEILQDSLEALLSGEAELDGLLARYPQYSEELKPRLEAVMWLEKRKPALDPPPGFIEASASRLVAKLEGEASAGSVAMQAEGVGPLDWVSAWLTRLVTGFDRRTAFQFATALVLIIGLLFGFFSAARASKSALPGEPLYGLKVGLERVEFSLAFSDFKRAELNVRFAERRLQEIQELVQNKRYDHVAQAVTNFQDQVQRANESLEVAAKRDPARTRQLAVQLEESLAGQQAVFTAMAQVVPTQVRPEIDRLLAATDLGLAQTQQLLDLISDLIGPIGTRTPIVTIEATSTPTLTATPTLDPTSTVTPIELSPTPTITQTITVTSTIGSSVAESTPTVSAVQNSSEGDSTDKVKTDKKPKKTKKLPVPPNRPIDPPGQDK